MVIKNMKWLLLACLFSSSQAFAHTGIGATHSLLDGFAHPFFGMDHLLVMFAVGLWGCLLGGRRLWLLPLSFLSFMAVGAGLHFAGFALQAAEQWVALSVLVVGLVLWRNWQASSAWAMALVMLFAVSHGYVHAAEISADANQWGYASGFLIATAILHGLGMSTGLLSAKTVKAIRIVLAVLCSAVGASLLAGLSF